MKNSLKNLIVLGSKADPHVSRVTEEIKALGANVHILDYLDETQFSLSMDDKGSFIIEIDGVVILDYLVWDRTKLIPGSPLYVQGEPEEREFAANEWLAMYKLVAGLGGYRVVNSAASKMCQIKPYQQMLAAKCGFLVPPSLVTNRKACLEDFFKDQSNNIIMKSLSATNIKSESDDSYYYVMTMRLAEQDVMDAPQEQIAFCPHFFQREIKKSCELRVIVIGEAILVFHIDSQKHKLTSLDWRNGQELISFDLIECDGHLKERLRNYMRISGLFSGSFDIVIDHDGNAWFLECNQDGAWGWLDNRVDGLVARTFAEQIWRRMQDSSESRNTFPAPHESVLHTRESMQSEC